MTAKTSLTKTDLEKAERFSSVIKERGDTYGSASLRTVIVRGQEVGEWRNCITLVNFSHKGDPEEKDVTFRYPNCILAKRTLRVTDLAYMVEQMISKGKMIVADLYPVVVDGHFTSPTTSEYLSSGDEIFNSQWPSDLFVFEPATRGGYPMEPFAALDAPLFPGPFELLRVWTGVDVSRYSQFLGCIALLLPDYSARIEELRLTPDNLTIQLERLELGTETIVGKLYAEKLGENIVQSDISFEKDSAVVPLGFMPDFWQFYLLAKDTGSVLDYRKIHASWPNLPAGVQIEVGSADVEEVIRRGENEQVEFKQDISHKVEEFMETIVAFANTNGGAILIGIDDNGTVVGVPEQKFEERLHNMVRDTTEPAPEVNVESLELHGKNVYVVNVPRGKEKPYNLRNHGFYVRAGSTDRLASRIEMDLMYSTRRVPIGTYATSIT